MPFRTYSESEVIAITIIEGELTKSEQRRGSLTVKTEFLKRYDPKKHKIDVIIREM
jgi:hypothetical protein